VGLDLDIVLHQLAQFGPGKRAGVRTLGNLIALDEQHRGEAQFFEQRVRVLQEPLVAVVERDQHGLFRKLALLQKMSKQVFEPDGAVAFSFEIAHLLERARPDDQGPSAAPRYCVDEHRDELVAGRIDTSEIPFVLWNHDLDSRGE
jgi:hypothetical protein